MMFLRSYLGSLLLLFSAHCFAQSPENPSMEFDQGVARVKWQSQTGSAYFLQFSTDLKNWRYFPSVIEAGNGQEKEWMFSTPESQIFTRLKSYNSSSVSPEDDDPDGDGFSNFYEVNLLGADPLDQSDPEGVNFDLDNDGLDDFWETENFGHTDYGPDEDLDGDGLTNLEELEQGTDPEASDEVGIGSSFGGGETFSGIISIPTNEESFDFTGTGDEDELTTSSNTFNWTDGASSLFVVVGIHSSEYPIYTDPECTTTDDDGNEVPCEFNDLVTYKVTPSVGEEKTMTYDVNDLDAEWDTKGKDFDLGKGSNFYLFKEQFVVENKERTPFSVDVKIDVTNIGDEFLPSGATVGMYPVQIQPKAVSAGMVGDLIMSNKGKSGEKHFVSTRLNNHLDTEYIEFEVTGISKEIFDEFLEWEGGMDGAKTTERKVSRGAAQQTVLKVIVKENQQVVDLMNVWTTWATIDGNVEEPLIAPRRGNGFKVGESVHCFYRATATIIPNAIITAQDHPNLTGKNKTPPPGGVNAKGQPLAGGANTKWDMSRRLKKTITINSNPELVLSMLDRQNEFFPTNKLIGNDDAKVDKDPINPYARNGIFRSVDTPRRSFALQGGDISSTYSNLICFQEFARLEINGKWYLLSEADDWSVHFRFKKENITEASTGIDTNKDGDLEDFVLESQAGGDLNGDGDDTDIVTRWINDNSNTVN